MLCILWALLINQLGNAQQRQMSKVRTAVELSMTDFRQTFCVPMFEIPVCIKGISFEEVPQISNLVVIYRFLRRP